MIADLDELDPADQERLVVFVGESGPAVAENRKKGRTKTADTVWTTGFQPIPVRLPNRR